MKIFIITIVLFFLSNNINAKNLYILFNNTSLINKDVKIANLSLGIPVKLLKEEDKRMKISFSAYLYKNELYSTSLKKIKIGEYLNEFKYKESNKDIILEGFISINNLSEDKDKVWSKDKDFYLEMCTQCHSEYVVSKYSKVEWSSYFKIMKRLAKLDKKESFNMERYLKFNAKDGLYHQK